MPPTPFSSIVMEESRSKIVTRSSRRSEKVALALSDSKKMKISQEKVLEGRMVTGSDYSDETWMRLREGTNWSNESEFANVEKLMLSRGELSLEKSLCITLLQAQKVMTSWARPRELFALNQSSGNDTTPSTPRSSTNDCQFTSTADMKCPMSEELAFWKRLREKLSKLNPETSADFSELPKHQFSADNVVVLPPFCGLMPEGLPSEQRSLDIWESKSDVTVFNGKENSERKTAQESYQINNTNQNATNGRLSQEDRITAAGLVGTITWDELNEKFEEVEKLLVGVFQQASDYLQTFDVLRKSILAIAETGMVHWLKMEPQEIMDALRAQANAITQTAWISSNPAKATKSKVLSLGVSNDGFLEPWKRVREAVDVHRESRVEAKLLASETKVSQTLAEKAGKVTLGSGKEAPMEDFHRVRELFIQAFAEGLFGIQVDNVKYVSKHLNESVISRALTVDVRDLNKWMETKNMAEIVKGEKIEVTNKNRSAKVQPESVPDECWLEQSLEQKIVESVGSVEKLVCYFLDENEKIVNKVREEKDNEDSEIRLSGYFPKEKYPKPSKTSDSKQSEFSQRDWLKSNWQQLCGCPLDELIEWLKVEGEILTSEKSFSENCEQKIGPNMKCKLERKIYLAAAAYGFIEWLFGNVETLDSAVFEYADVVRHIAKMLNLEIKHVNKCDQVFLGCEKDNSTILWTRLRESWKSNQAVRAIIEEEKSRLKFMQNPGKTVSNMLALSHEASAEIYQRPRELFLQAFMEGKLELHVNGTPFAADKLTKIVLSRALNCDFNSIEKWFRTEEIQKKKGKNDAGNDFNFQLLKKDKLPNYCDYKSSVKHESFLGKSFSRKVLLYMLDVTLSYREVNRKTDRKKTVRLQRKSLEDENETIVIYGKKLSVRSKTTIEQTENIDKDTEIIVVYGSGLSVSTKVTTAQKLNSEKETKTIVIYGRNLSFRRKTTIEQKEKENCDSETVVVYGSNLTVENSTTIDKKENTFYNNEVIIFNGMNLGFRFKTILGRKKSTEDDESNTETNVVYSRHSSVRNKTIQKTVEKVNFHEKTESIVIYGRNLRIRNEINLVQTEKTEKDTETIAVYGSNLKVRTGSKYNENENKPDDSQSSGVLSGTLKVGDKTTTDEKLNFDEENETIVIYGSNLVIRRAPIGRKEKQDNYDAETVVVYGRNLSVRNKTPNVGKNNFDKETDAIDIYGKNRSVTNRTTLEKGVEHKNIKTIIVYGKNLSVRNKTTLVRNENTEDDTETIVVYGKNMHFKNTATDSQIERTQGDTKPTAVCGNIRSFRNRKTIVEEANIEDDTEKIAIFGTNLTVRVENEETVNNSQILAMSSKNTDFKNSNIEVNSDDAEEEDETMATYGETLYVENSLSKEINGRVDDDVNNPEEIIKLPAKLDLPKQPNVEKPSVTFQNDFSVQNLLKFFSNSSSAICLEDVIKWFSESSQIFPSKRKFAEKSDSASGPKSRCEAEKVLFSAAASFGFIEWLFGNIELLDPAVFDHADVVRHISKVINSALDQIIKDATLQFGCEENAMIVWNRLRESIKSSEAVNLLTEIENARSAVMQEPKIEQIKLLGKPCEALPDGYYRPREMFVDDFTEGIIESHVDGTPHSADLLSKSVLSRALRKEVEELEKWLNASTFTEWHGKPAIEQKRTLASHEILEGNCSNTKKLIYENIFGKSFTNKLFTYIVDANLSAEENKNEIEEADGVIRLPGKLSMEKYSESNKVDKKFQENFSVKNLLTYFMNATSALSLTSCIDWAGVSSQILPAQKKSAERTDLISGPTCKCDVEKTLFLAAASYGFIEWLFGDVHVLKDALFVYAELLKQISELLPASCGKVLEDVIKLARERDVELSWMRLREKEIYTLACKSDIKEQPISVSGKIIGSNYADASTNGRAREEIMEEFSRAREIIINDMNICSPSEEKDRMSLEDKLHKIVALSYGLGLNEELSVMWNDLNSLKTLTTKVPKEMPLVSISEEHLKKLKQSKEDMLEQILNGLGQESGVVKYLEAEEDVEVIEFLTMPIQEQLLMREKQSKPLPSKQFSEALAQIECQCFETASATDVLSKQELIAELVQNLYGKVGDLKEAGSQRKTRDVPENAESFQNAACFKRHTSSWFTAKTENKVLNSSLSSSCAEESLDNLEAESYVDVANDLSQKEEVERLASLHAAKYAQMVEFFIKEKLLDSIKWLDDIDDLFLDLPCMGSETLVFQDHESMPDGVKMALNRCNMVSEESKSTDVPLRKAKSLDDWNAANVMSAESVENSDWIAEDLVENVPDYLLVASGKDDYISLYSCEEKSYENEKKVLEAFSENYISKDEQFDAIEAVFSGLGKSEEIDYKFAKEDLQSVEALSLPFEKKLMTAEISNRFHQMSIESSEAIAENELRLIQTALLSSDDVSKLELALYSGSDSSSDSYELSVSNMVQWLPVGEDGNSGSDCKPKMTRQGRYRELMSVPMSTRHTNMWLDLNQNMPVSNCDEQRADEVNDNISEDQNITEFSSMFAKDELCENNFNSRADLNQKMSITSCDEQRADEVNENISDDQNITSFSSMYAEDQLCGNDLSSRLDLNQNMPVTNCDEQRADEVDDNISEDQNITEFSSMFTEDQLCENNFNSRADLSQNMSVTNCDEQGADEVNENISDGQNITALSSMFADDQLCGNNFSSRADLSQNLRVVHCDQQITNDLNEDISQNQQMATLNLTSAEDEFCRNNLEGGQLAVNLVFLFIMTTSEEHSSEKLLRFDAEEWTFPDIRFHDVIFEIAVSANAPQILSKFVATDEQDQEIDEHIYPETVKEVQLPPPRFPYMEKDLEVFLVDGDEDSDDEFQSDEDIETDEEIVPREVTEKQQPTNRFEPAPEKEPEEIEEERIEPRSVKEQQNPTHLFMPPHYCYENASTFTGSFEITDESYSSVFAVGSESESEYESADEGKFQVDEKDSLVSLPAFEDEHCDEASVPVKTPARVQLGVNENEMDVITRQSVPQAIFEVRAGIPVAYDHEKDKYIYDIKTESFKIDPAVINNMTIKVTRDSAKQKVEALARAERTNKSNANMGVNPAAINNMTIKVTRDSSRHKLEAHALRGREMSEARSVAAISPNIHIDPASINNMTIKVSRDSSKQKMESISNGKANCSGALSESSRVGLLCGSSSGYGELESKVRAGSVGYFGGLSSEECKKDAANIKNMTIKVTRKSHKQIQELRNVKVEHYYDDVISGEYHLERGCSKKWKSGLMETSQKGKSEKIFFDNMGYVVPPSTKMNVCVSRKHYNRGSQEMKKEKFRSRSRSLPREEVEHA